MHLPVHFITTPGPDSASSCTEYGASNRQRLRQPFNRHRRTSVPRIDFRRLAMIDGPKNTSIELEWYDHKTRRG